MDGVTVVVDTVTVVADDDMDVEAVQPRAPTVATSTKVISLRCFTALLLLTSSLRLSDCPYPHYSRYPYRCPARAVSLQVTGLFDMFLARTDTVSSLDDADAMLAAIRGVGPEGKTQDVSCRYRSYCRPGTEAASRKEGQRR